jgi:hypothetical protein
MQGILDFIHIFVPTYELAHWTPIQFVFMTYMITYCSFKAVSKENRKS